MTTRPDSKTLTGGQPLLQVDRPRRLYPAAAIGLLAFFGAASGAWAQGAASTSDQQLQDRLLGKPSAAADQAAPDCSTAKALESNPDCGQPVKGGERGFKLFDQGRRPAATTPSKTTSSGKRSGGALVSQRSPRADRGSSAAAPCAMADASNSRAVNLCVTFAVNSTALTSQSRQSLDKLVTALNSQQISGRNVVIEGYADSSGNAAANLKLSDGRAHAVADYLAGHGVTRSRIDAKGLGATNLLAGRASTDPANRRVEARLKD